MLLNISNKVLVRAIVFFCLCTSTFSVQASKTFFSHRSMQSDITIFKTTSDSFINRNIPSDRFDFSGTVFYQESTNAKDLARYFLIGGKTELTIGGINAPGVPDISGTWLQIAGKNDPAVPKHFPDNGIGLPDGSPRTIDNEDLYFNQFSSTINIRPEFKRFGAVLRAFKSFECSCHKLWVDVTLPFVQVQTDLKLNEFDIQNAFTSRDDIPDFDINNTAGPANSRVERPTSCTMLNGAEALSNPSWKYGKFKQGVQKLAGLADITLKLGYSPIKNEQTKWNLYSNFIIPTGYKPRSENVFEPIIGNGQHFGLGAGTSLDLEIFSNACYESHFTTNFEYTYLFRNTQVRSFDLTSNGEWSRYLLVFFPGNPLSGDNKTPTPGINVFSQPMHVTPQSEVNWTSAFNFNVAAWSFHVGYNLWWKQKEKVRLASPWNQQVAIMHFSDADDGNIPFTLTSFSTATIKDHFLGPDGNLPLGSDANITLVDPANFNLSSAAHPSVIGHKIYGAIGYSLQWAGQPIELSIGGAYQVNKSIKAVQDWSTWLQVSLPV